MAYPAKAIANYFIKKSIAENDSSLSPLKLIKLIYVAHGWYLAVHNQPLIDEPIQAWKYGPMVESVYHEFKYYGNRPIDTLANGLEIEHGEIVRKNYDIPQSDTETIELLNRVWELYKDYTAIQLANWSHEPDGPWYKIWNFQGSNNIIPDDLIGSFFKGMASGNPN